MQIHDFIRIYEAKTDEELLVVARDMGRLTLEARAALESELSRRGLQQTEIEQTVEEVSPMAQVITGPYSSTSEFLVGVTRTYREHFWLFFTLIAPAAVLSFYLVLRVRERAISALYLSFQLGSRSMEATLAEARLIGYATYFASWIFFCIAYAGIASAVVRLGSGQTPSIHHCFANLSNRKWPFLKISALLFFLLGIAVFFKNLVVGGFFLLFTREALSWTGRLFEYAITLIVMAAVSRLALAIPIVLHDAVGARDSLFRSDELTEGRWIALFVLVFKSVWGAYILGKLPFWFAGWTSEYFHFRSWFLTLASVTAVALVEPFMFIGFSLMYVTARGDDRRAPQEAAVQST
jgi:hypothetical protein